MSTGSTPQDRTFRRAQAAPGRLDDDQKSDHKTEGVKRGVYSIEITRDALDHVRALPKKHRALVLQTVRTRLTHEPTTENRNRKLLTLPAPFGAYWELRFGPHNRFRAFYTIEGTTVLIVAIGVKHRERLRIGHEEVRSREGRVHRRGEGKAK